MSETLDFPAIVELFGHTRLAGTVSEHSMGGATMIRIDVPETSKNPKFTKFVNPSAVYALNPITEEMMQNMAEEIQAKPIRAYDLRDVQAILMREVQDAKKELGMGEPSDDMPEIPDYEDDGDDLPFAP